ncbi:MAG: glycosyl hydrolase [archaeon]
MKNKIKIKDYFGINISPTLCRDTDLWLKKLREIGVGWVRLEFDWYNPKFEKFDLFILGLEKAKIQILGSTIGFVPGNLKYLLYPPKKYSPFNDLPVYLEFLEKCCKRYPNIRYWEIYNEPNLKRFWINKPDPKEYLVMLRKGSKIIRKYGGKVVCGGIAFNDEMHMPFVRRHFLKDLIRLGADDYVDFFNIHPYSLTCYMSFAKKESFMKQIRREIDSVISRFGKDVWITEWGISDLWNFGVSSEDIGLIYLYALKYAASKGIKLFIWNFNDFIIKGNFPPEGSFGLIDANNKEKDSFRILANALKND